MVAEPGTSDPGPLEGIALAWVRGGHGIWSTMNVEALDARFQALEQALVAAQASAQQAEVRAAAAELQSQQTQQAQAAAAPVAEAVRAAPMVDTRLLGKPRNFDGMDASWRGFRFSPTAYAGAVNPRLAELMNSAVTATEPQALCAALGPTDRAWSAQLYYMLALSTEGAAARIVELAGAPEGLLAWRRLLATYEPDTAGRHATLLLQVLNYEFEGEPRSALEGFELAIRKYEESSRGEVVDALKIALVQRGLKDPVLRDHLLLHAGRLATYQAVR